LARIAPAGGAVGQVAVEPQPVEFGADVVMAGNGFDRRARPSAFEGLLAHDAEPLDGCFEMIGIAKAPMGEVMTLEITPGAFDVVLLGRLL
jgi:hypothetical protein